MNREVKRAGKGFTITAAEAAVVAGVMILLAGLFDYRYATNDDVFIRAIVSGKYSGMPDIHNIQSIVLLNGLFVLLYRICRFIPWFGIFMVVSQFVSLYEILVCLIKKIGLPGRYRFLCAAAVNVLLCGIMLQELVILQYTYTAALLITSATARLYCEAGKEDSEGRGRGWYVSLLMHFLVAFCLRTEIFLFLLPFPSLMTVICCSGSGAKFLIRKMRRWGIFWGSLMLCVGVLYAADYMGYTGKAFREYRQLFDSRTQLYDYLTLPDYEGNREFYEEAEISEAQYMLLKNYNFSLDEEITSQTLKSVVDYANERRMSQYQGVKRLYMQMFTLPLREGIWSYTHRVLADPKVAADDSPWNFVCAALYLTMLVLICFTRRIRNLVSIFLMFSMRSMLWMYIILRQRTPSRVTHSLFLMEIVCLLLLVFEELSHLEKKEDAKKTRWLYPGAAALFLAGAGAVSVFTWSSFRGVYEQTVIYNNEWNSLLEYCSERGENFYFMDVYSTVNYSRKIFERELSGPENYDICGGWLAKSPLCEEKYSHFGFFSPRMALIEEDNVFLVAEQGCDLEWLYRVYEEKGIQIRLEYQESVAGQFDIIKLSASKER